MNLVSSISPSPVFETGTPSYLYTHAHTHTYTYTHTQCSSPASASRRRDKLRSMLETERKGLWGRSQERHECYLEPFLFFFWFIFFKCADAQHLSVCSFNSTLCELLLLETDLLPGRCNHTAPANATHVFMNSIYKLFFFYL